MKPSTSVAGRDSFRDQIRSARRQLRQLYYNPSDPERFIFEKDEIDRKLAALESTR